MMNYENSQKICPICHKKSVKQIDAVFLGKVMSFSQLQKYAVIDIVVELYLLQYYPFLSLKSLISYAHIYTRTHNQVGNWSFSYILKIY